MNSARTLNILVTGVGGTHGLGTIANLRRSRLPVRLVGADVAWTAAGLYQVDRAALLPRVDDDRFDTAFAALCRREHIDAVFIASGTETGRLAGRRDALEGTSGALLVVNAPDLISLAADKLRTADKLRAWQFAAPATAAASSRQDVTRLVEEVGFPVIAKPRFGQGSRGIRLVHGTEELEAVLDDSVPYVVQEHIGDIDHEYTVGVIADEDGTTMGAIVLRRWLKDGQTAACEVVDEPSIAGYAEAIAARLRPRGYLNVQLRLRDGEPCAFELNARVSSSTGFRGLAGFNEPEMILTRYLLGKTPARPEVKKIRMIRSLVEQVVSDERWCALAPS